MANFICGKQCAQRTVISVWIRMKGARLNVFKDYVITHFFWLDKYWVIKFLCHLLIFALKTTHHNQAGHNDTTAYNGNSINVLVAPLLPIFPLRILQLFFLVVLPNQSRPLTEPCRSFIHSGCSENSITIFGRRSGI